MLTEKLIKGIFNTPRNMLTTTGGRLALGACIGAGAVTYSALPDVGFQNSTEVHGGTGEVLEVFATVPKETLSGYTSQINGASAEYRTSLTGDIGPLHLNVPTGFSDKETCSTKLTSEVATTPQNYKITVDVNKRKATATVPKEAFSTVVYPTDPASNACHTEQNGPLTALGKVGEDMIKVIPGLNFTGNAEDIAGNLRGLAYLAMQKTQAEKCGAAAWSLIAKIEVAQLQNSLANNAKLQQPFGGNPLKPADITVLLPDTMSFSTQYTQKYDQLTQTMKDKGINVSLPTDFTCEVSDSAKSKMAAVGTV